MDERLFPGNIKIIEEKFGAAPKTEFDFRKVLEDKDIDVISIATPDHWHALMTDHGLPGRKGCLCGETCLP